MNKTELIEHIAKQADISKAAADARAGCPDRWREDHAEEDGSVTIVGFGTFAVTKRASRTGRNPRTGAAIKIKAAKVPKFRPARP
jgi:DNA-binding protein HU-beta